LCPGDKIRDQNKTALFHSVAAGSSQQSFLSVSMRPCIHNQQSAQQNAGLRHLDTKPTAQTLLRTVSCD